MALTKLPYKRLQHLIGLHLSTAEDPSTAVLIKEFSAVRKRGYLTRPELIKVCRWKSARAIRHIRRNRAATVRKVTGAAFATRSEQKKLSLLTSLYGVSIPMASAILTLTYPSRYGVIDIRVWQLLYKMGSVTSNAGGKGFDFKQWYLFLMIIRYFARLYEVNARDIERTLFNVHVRYQRGVLYGR
ncbi:MAG: hypothetical protein NTU47_02685 [Ignavibacteriales bacterium]|nr:hypothetical protein [Ignavibacteriales bacterium]